MSDSIKCPHVQCRKDRHPLPVTEIIVLDEDYYLELCELCYKRIKLSVIEHMIQDTTKIFAETSAFVHIGAGGLDG